MRRLKRRLDPQAVARALIKSKDPKHQIKFASRMEKWAASVRDVIRARQALEVDSSGNVSVASL